MAALDDPASPYPCPLLPSFCLAFVPRAVCQVAHTSNTGDSRDTSRFKREMVSDRQAVMSDALCSGEKSPLGPDLSRRRSSEAVTPCCDRWIPFLSVCSLLLT